MKKKMKKWFSCIIATAMVMSTVNLPTNILASDFDDGVEISVEDENEDAPEVVVDGEEGSDFSDEEVAVIEDSDVTGKVADDISSENGDEQLFSDHVDEDIDAVVDDGDSAYAVGTSEAEAIVNVAKGEVGVSGRPNKYTRWYGKINNSYSYSWCHAFVSWCADQAGVADKVPKTAACRTGVTWFKNKGQWKARSSGYIPSAGDIIYFDFNSDGTSDHVGIVTGSSNGRVYTIEGNAKDTVKVNGGYSNGYAINSSNILGYGVPAYSSTNPEPTNGIRSYGFDAPSNGEKITGNTFLFQGWVDANKTIKDITCSINGGAKYVTTGLYKREDVPNATAFRAEISSDVLNMGANKVAVCVNFQDNTGVVVEERTVNRGLKGIESYGFDAPSNGEKITGSTFLFQGWVDASKEINSITCSVNGGYKYITTDLYKRADVPNATAFRAEISSDILNMGDNRVAVCVNFQDNTGVVVEERTVNRGLEGIESYGFDVPSNGDEITGDTFLFQGWVDASKEINSITCSVNGGSKYITTNLYKREDVPNATAFRAEISSDVLNWGNNRVALCVNFQDNTGVVLEERTITKQKPKVLLGYDSPVENDQIGEEQFQFSGWIETTRKMDNLVCSINGGEQEIAALFYKREDVPNAVAFRADISASYLNYGDNEVAVCVNWSDGEKEVLETRKVIKCMYDYIESPQEKQVITCKDTKFLLQGWSINDKKEIDHFEYVLNNQRYKTVAHTRSDLASNARYYRVEIRNDLLVNGNNTINVRVYYSDGTSRNIGQVNVVGNLDHIWDNGEVIKQATCTTEGQKIYTCTICKNTKIESVSKTSHKEVKDVAVSATCESTGKTEGSHCSICNTIIKKQETIPATGHTWDNGKITKQATCTTDGQKIYTCTSCKKTKTESITKTGHKEVKDVAVSATCESTGKTEGSHCSVCGTVIKNQETIPAMGHTWDGGKITREATCTTDGQRTYTCASCKNTKTESISKTGHKEVKDVAVSATCENTGKTEGSHCSICGTVIKKQETIPATGHTWDSGKVTKQPTCTTDGQKTYTCTTCKKTKTENISKTGHKEVKDAAVSATCENTGKTEGSHCSVCNTVIKKQETLPALGHTWDSGKVTKAATCTTDGEKTYTCTTCHKTRTESIAKTGHTEVKDAATPATCENTGKTEGSHCSVCNTVIKKQETLPALGHTWDSGKVTKAATCTTDGEKTYTCTTCHKTRTESIPKTGHTEVKDAATPATCENTGKTEGSHCSICGTVIKQQEPLPATGHTWDNGKATKQASCTENGEKLYTCTTCQKTRTETIPTTGHTEITKFAKKATCETEGYTGDIYCNNCGEMLKEGKVIEKLSHDWKLTGTKKATCTAGGENTYTCTRCKKNKTEQIPATGHKWSTWWKLSDATVFKPQKQQRTCSLCHISQTRDYGSKLKSVMRTSCSSLLLKTKQTTNVLTVSGMAKGDYVSKVTSGNTGIVRVTRYTKDGKIQLTAQGRTGNTSITIQLAGGAVKRINVKVQSGIVKTTAIRVSFTKATIKAGTKKTISTTVTPSTSQEKVTYTTSNKNIATVTANGIITARKRGTTKITVKSGSKKQIITVTVK